MLRPALVLLFAAFQTAQGQLGYGGSPNAGARATNNVDPPWCATRTAGFINDMTSLAQNAVAMTGDCVGDAISDTACAGDVFSLLVSLTDGMEMLSDLSNACAGERSSCVSSALDTVEYVFTLAVNLIGASINCDTDVFICLINCVDAADNIVDMAQDIVSATMNCPIMPIKTTTALPPRLLPSNKSLMAQVMPHPDTVLGPYKANEISPFYAAIAGGIKGATMKPGSRGFVLKGGKSSTTAIEDFGPIRFSGEYILPRSDVPLPVAGDGEVTNNLARRLSEGDLTFPIEEVDEIEAHDVEVYFFDNKNELKILREDGVSDDELNDIQGFSDVAYE